jgi:hypothetical protein
MWNRHILIGGKEKLNPRQKVEQLNNAIYVSSMMIVKCR